MPRIEIVEQPEGKAKELLDGVQKKLGKVPNIYASMAHAPNVLEFALKGGSMLGNGDISARLREQIALLSAGLNGCGYCAAAHTVIGKNTGLSEEEAKAALSGGAEDSKEQAALSFAKTVIENRGQIKDSDFEAVKEAGYTDGEIIEIIAAVAFNAFTNYFNDVVDTEVDFPEVSLPENKHAAE